MLKRIVAFMMLSIFAIQAQASSPEGLKSAFDELHFALTVEWDQQDQHFYEQQMKTFEAKLNELQAGGLTAEDLLTFAKLQVNDTQTVKSLEEAINLIQVNKMPLDKAHDLIIHVMENSYSKGASWNELHGWLLATGILFAMLTVIIIGGVKAQRECEVNGWHCG